MMTTLIRNAQLVNEGEIFEADVFIKGEYIHTIGKNLQVIADEVIDARGLYLLPGVIDDQVHFREPGLTHKGDIASESRAAVAGGITSFMEMPNTNPQTLTQALLEEKYARAAQVSPANYSFFMGASNDNLEEVLKTNSQNVCGVKVFMGSSTGNMLVDDETVLENIFKEVPLLIATHCESEAIVRKNQAEFQAKYGDALSPIHHPQIRSEEACYASSSKAVALAKKYNTRLHILHISTAKEIELFDNQLPLSQKRITAEACVHHLWFSDEDYAEKGNFIKWNPAVKRAEDRAAIRQALLDDKIDIVATDHAPHTLAEKELPYAKAPSGGPLVQHSLVAMLELARAGVFTIEKVVEKMCHAPAICFEVSKRGFIREGYFADLVLIKMDTPWTVTKNNLLYKCQWSPFDGLTFNAQVNKTFVNGNCVYDSGNFRKFLSGKRLTFERN
ncbi:MAG: dihydroorotase [Bacteroidia bacterium]